MDLDGDGVQDVITGSWPGELYVFKGRKGPDGTRRHDAPVKLVDKDGKEILTGQASAVWAGDWDRDGDVDLVVGCIDGWVWWVPNESGSKALAFGAATKVEAGGAPIHEHHSGPTVADWDGDGTLDLLVGQGDGSVVLYANAARAGTPKLAAARVLHAGKDGGRSDGSTCGGRVKPHVVDWNADGRLDLLFGDFAVKQPDPPALSAEQQEELRDLAAQQRAVLEKLTPLYAEVTDQVLKALGHEVPQDPMQRGAFFKTLSDEQRKSYSEAVGKALAEHAGIQELQASNRALFAKIRPLKGSPSVVGHVWVRLREATAGTTAPGAQD